MIRGEYYPVSGTGRMAESIARKQYDPGLLRLGAYALVDGSAPSAAFSYDSFQTAEPPVRARRPGLKLHGILEYADNIYPVVSFRYNTSGPYDRRLHRLIVWTGVGAGQLPAHTNLPPCETIVGPQIGVFNPETKLIATVKEGIELSSGHFPTVCYFDGPFGVEPLSADPWPQVGG